MLVARSAVWLAVMLLVGLPLGEANADDFRVLVDCGGIDGLREDSEDARSILMAEAESYVKRELRAIGDVAVVHDLDSADFWLELTVFRTQSGYFLSATYFVVTHTTDGNRWWDFGQIPEGCADSVDRVLAWFDGSLTYANGMYITRSPDALKDGCEVIVANFDTLTLEPRRAALGQ